MSDGPNRSPEYNPDRLLRAVFDSTLMIGVTMTLDELQQLVVRSDDIGSWIGEQLAAGDAPDDVLLGTISRGVAGGTLRPEEGVAILHTLLSAGGESTTSLLGNATRILAERPDLHQQPRDDPELVPTFLEEVLRLESPFRVMLRSVPADTTLDDGVIPSGATVLLFFSAANRDPAEFDQPDELMLGREVPRHHVAFGRGIHHCVGAPLATRSTRRSHPAPGHDVLREPRPRASTHSRQEPARPPPRDPPPRRQRELTLRPTGTAPNTRTERSLTGPKGEHRTAFDAAGASRDGCLADDELSCDLAVAESWAIGERTSASRGSDRQGAGLPVRLDPLSSRRRSRPGGGVGRLGR